MELQTNLDTTSSKIENRFLLQAGSYRKHETIVHLSGPPQLKLPKGNSSLSFLHTKCNTEMII